MLLDLKTLAIDKAKDTQTFDLITRPGTQIKVRPLDLEAQYRARDAIAEKYNSVKKDIPAKQPAEDGKEEEEGDEDLARLEVIRVMQDSFKAPDCAYLKETLADENDDLVFAGKTLDEVYQTILKWPVDVYAEIVQCVFLVSPLSQEQIIKRDQHLAEVEERKKQQALTAKLENSTELCSPSDAPAQES